ncbi:MAG: hypothetical protein LBF63_06005 [Treponema sp.]|jgi:hypothetical protein|nr:hypothetical protein [Treponema sp.]
MAAFTKNDIRINRNGRPRKGQSLTEALEKELRKKRATGKTGKVELARTLVDLAINDRDVAALKYIYDRLDGKPRESIDTTISGAMAIGNIETVENKLMEILNLDHHSADA